MEYASIASSTIEFSLKTIKCPECKKKRVWQDPSCGEFVCCSCGIVINENEILIKKAQDRGINIKKSELYLQAFRYGMPPEGGFSFGSERIVMGVLDLSNIREASLFPRDMERIDQRFSAQSDVSSKK